MLRPPAIVFLITFCWCNRLVFAFLFEAKVKVEMMSRSQSMAIKVKNAEGDDSNDEAAQSLMELASRHFASQALHAFVKMEIPGILGISFMSIDQISDLLDEDIGERRKVNRDGLLRILRLMVAEGVLVQNKANNEQEITTFGLSAKGKLLRRGSQRDLASVVLHWMETPLWNAWAELPDYIVGDSAVGQDTEESGRARKEILPFEKANRISSDDFYCQDNAESLKNANAFVRYISNEEEEAVLSGFNWAKLSGKTLLDVGGHKGKVMSLIASKYPEIKCISFDLPEVISSATAPEGVELFGGDIFQGDLPSCDAIFMKHFLDKVMWDEEQTIQILSSCRDALPDGGHIIIAEAVLPDDCSSATGTNRLHLYIDVLFLLVGREAARTESEWRNLAEKAGLRVDWITATSAPSCYIIVLSKA